MLHQEPKLSQLSAQNASVSMLDAQSQVNLILSYPKSILSNPRRTILSYLIPGLSWRSDTDTSLTSAVQTSTSSWRSHQSTRKSNSTRRKYPTVSGCPYRWIYIIRKPFSWDVCFRNTQQVPWSMTPTDILQRSTSSATRRGCSLAWRRFSWRFNRQRGTRKFLVLTLMTRNKMMKRMPSPQNCLNRRTEFSLNINNINIDPYLWSEY